MLTTLDLFAGIGGFALGFEETGLFKTTCFVENEPYCQAVLKHHWPHVPVLGDIYDVKGRDLPEPHPDVIVGGFPCQPYSQAGQQRAQSDPRDLWPEMFRLVRECRPTWVVGENVVGLVQLGLDRVLSDLESEGYATRTFNIPAFAVGAPHQRQRLWIVAHSHSPSEPDVPIDGDAGRRQLGFDFMADTGCKSEGSEVSGSRNERIKRASERQRREAWHRSGNIREDVADTDSSGFVKRRGSVSMETQYTSAECSRQGQSPSNWLTEPNVGRVAHGVPARVAQLRALGNALVPQIATQIGMAIGRVHQ
jgi:DNA (cytosine-5)-methyltransferase 1